MLMGRMGILSFMLALYGKGEESRIKPPEASYCYEEEK
jgi:trk system potassium uptake protein TrkH